MKSLLLSLLLFVASLALSSTASAQNGLTNQQVISSAVTYYVCAKANGGTCVYNGDAGTVAATIADTNNCLAKATPCRTIAGVQALIANKIIGAVVTIQLATVANTGTDCYRPQGTVFDNPVARGLSIEALEAEEQNVSMTYPNNYIKIVGDTTTPNNVVVIGNTCGSTTAVDLSGIKFTNTIARVAGINFRAFLGGASGPDNGAVMGYNSVIYADTDNFNGPTGGSNAYGVLGYNHSVIHWGGTMNVTDMNAVEGLNLSHVDVQSPAGRSNTTVVENTGVSLQNAIFSANENSHFGWDGATLTVSGAGTAIVFNAFDHSAFYWNDASTFNSPAQTISINGANFTVYQAADRSYVNDLCRTTGSLTCNIGNTTAVSVHHSAVRGSFIAYNSVATGATTEDSVTTGSTIINTGNGTGLSIASNTLLIGGAAPTISSGFGTSPSVTANNGTAAFEVNVGTGGSATSGVIGLPTATTGWNCFATDITTKSATVFITKQTASSTTTATVGNFNTSGAAAAWVASDKLRVSCFAY